MLPALCNAEVSITALVLPTSFAFVRFFNRFPAQQPLEVEEDILAFASVQLNTNIQDCWQYGGRQKTVSVYQEAIRDYLGF